jgi:hypothetical protein
MEILIKLLENQDALEDALRLESTPEEVKETKYGRKLLRWIRRRRRVTNRVVKVLSKF